MVVDDPQGFAQGIENARERLAESTAVHDADRTAIERWVRRKSGSVKDSTLKTYLRRVRVASERADTPLVEMDEPDYHDLIFTLRHEHDLADATVKSYEDATLLFLGDMIDADWPAETERTTVRASALDPETVLTPADIGALTATASHQRDVAFIEFLADTGARLSLALSLRVCDIDLSEGPTYRPNPDATGLKGADIQEYPLIDSAAALRAYLRTSHPRPDVPNAALFHKIKPAARGEDGERWIDDGGVVANAMRQQLARIADRAGVEKPVNPHAFRHAAITRMAREGYSRSQIEHRVHWTIDSDMWEIYEHITGAEHNADIFREAGVVEDENGPDRVRRPCGNCREPLAPHHEYCPNCGAAVTAEAEATVAEDREELLDLLTETTNPATRRELRALLAELDDRPALVHDDPS